MNPKWLILVGTILTVLSASSAESCESSWVAYKDEKCFKLLTDFTNFDSALALCVSEIGGKLKEKDDDTIFPLLTIKSSEEQEFINQYIFVDNQVVDNVWIGGGRVNETDQFQWMDGSALEFTNWHEGSPSHIEGNDCLQILPKGVLLNSEKIESKQQTRHLEIQDEADGKWSDVSCVKRNLIVCQKLQTWSLQKLQKISLETTKVLTETRNELEHLKTNPVPIGFLYVQLPTQPNATSLWPQVAWVDVTADYGGLFFRAEGGTSAPFGTEQADSTRQLIKVQTHWSDVNDYQNLIDVPKSGMSGIVDAGEYFTDSSAKWEEGLSFENSNVEVRPRNTAVRIWKRTA